MINQKALTLLENALVLLEKREGRVFHGINCSMLRLDRPNTPNEGWYGIQFRTDGVQVIECRGLDAEGMSEWLKKEEYPSFAGVRDLYLSFVAGENESVRSKMRESIDFALVQSDTAELIDGDIYSMVTFSSWIGERFFAL